METVKNVIDAVYDYIWEFPKAFPYFIVLLLGTGIFLTVRLRFIQLRKVSHSLAIIAGYYDNPQDKGEINHFQALTAALSATIGIGNISGVAIAIHYGGPGALFWMWVTAILGTASKFVECTLSLHFREVHEDQTVSGGPMYYIEKGLGRPWKFMAVIFACCAVISSFGSGNAVQAFTVADSFRSDFGIPTWITGSSMAVIIALVIIGGIKRIGKVTSKLVPVMSVIYFLGAITVLLINAPLVPGAIGTIFRDAFTAKAGVGGFFGSSFMFMLIWGVKRGIFSNEAGQGSAPIAHAAAKTEEPVREGLVAMIGPYIDTLLICSLTGLVIVTVGVWSQKKDETITFKMQNEITMMKSEGRVQINGKIEEGDLMKDEFHISAGSAPEVVFIKNDSPIDDAIVWYENRRFTGRVTVDEDGAPHFQDERGREIPAGDVEVSGWILQNGSPLTGWAFQKGLSPLGNWGHYIVTIAVFLFALSTAISWSYYGDRSIEYLFGPPAIMPYRVVFCIMHFLGAVFSLEIVWGFGDTALGLMAIPNLIAIFALSGVVKKLTDDYFSRSHRRYKNSFFKK
ncbi:MAG: sodium:alanine symporter family protein [Candidatus Krumholzibacteriota bacterium]|nr:sodium:alanine symporter family protein [Candidatus Krumholzibacteriota bacterium]